MGTTAQTLIEQTVKALQPHLRPVNGTAESATQGKDADNRGGQRFANATREIWQQLLQNQSKEELRELLIALIELTESQVRDQVAKQLQELSPNAPQTERDRAVEYLVETLRQLKQSLPFERAPSVPANWEVGKLRELLVSAAMQAGTAANGQKPSPVPVQQSTPSWSSLPAGSEPGSSGKDVNLITGLRALLRWHGMVREAWRKLLRTCLVVGVVCMALAPALYSFVSWETFKQAEQNVAVDTAKGMPVYKLNGQVVPVTKYQTYLADAALTAKLEGYLSALVLVVVPVVLIYFWPRNEYRRLARALTDEIKAFAAKYHEPVRTWGGEEVLRHRALVEELLRLEDKGSR